ncbi:DNRLRE domain-containing protein [Streptomyces sp. NPDC090798]|uniref:DNRLRE domain-containing protein n=1 Tax=Streptomyces sp. NPDC090798 TaxID=3365968 RepID=UPI0038119B34
MNGRSSVYAAYAMAGVLTFGLGMPAAHPPAVAATPVASAAAASDDEDAAIGAARRSAAASGERVEVTALRTESSTTYVNSDGSVTVESATGPVWVKDDDGSWHDVDTTLVRRDGGIEPRRAAADIRISDGGSGPLAEVDEGDKTLGISWDGKLPEPEIHGNTAVYSNVRPDQDLVVSALPEGFSHQLVLKERPKDDVELRIPVAADGLKLRETSDDRLLWESDNGRHVAAAPVPVMWGATEGSASGEPAKVTDVDVSVENGSDGQTLVLKPDTSFLTDPAVKYPVTVDPTNTLLGPLTDTWIQDDDYPTSQRGSSELKAGTYNGTQRARSYLKFDTARFLGKHVVDADLRMYSYYSSSCSTDNSGIQVRRVTSDWDPSAISWGSQPGTTTVSAPVSKAAKGYNSSCPAGQVSWDIDGIAQAWADGQPNYGVRLAAVDETDPLTWRRYRSANYVDGSHDASTEPSLIVTYNSAPTVPTDLDVSPLKAGTTLTTAASLTPAFQVKVGDSDADSSLVTEFQVQPDPAFADTTYTWTGKTAAFAPGTVATARIPTASVAPDGSHLQMRARTGDGLDTSAWSGWKAFRVDATAVQPADLPTQLQAGATDTPAPLVSGVVTSPNGGMVEAQFRLGGADGTKTLGTQLVPDGERAGFQIPADRLTSGGPFDWSMRACYAGKCSAWTDKAPITAGSGAEPDQVAATSSVELPLTQATVCTDSDACVGQTGTGLKAGSVSGKNWRSYLKADLSKVPAGARVTNAVLKLQSGGTMPGLDVHALNAAWATTGTGSQLDAATAPEANVSATAPWSIDVTGLVTGWTDGADVNNGLVLRRPDDAPSTAGISFISATLTVDYASATAPSPPTSVRARAGDKGAVVIWEAGDDSGYNDSVLSYEVTALDSSGAVVAKLTTKGTDAVITGLTNGTTYTFRVSASNPYGTSDSVTSAQTRPLSAPLDSATYTRAIGEYLDAGASLTTGTQNNAAAAVSGRPNAAMYTWLLKAEESWLIDTRDSLKTNGLTYTSVTSSLSDALVLPSADGSVAVRVTVSGQQTPADTPEDPETSEETVLYTFSGGDTPVLRSRMNAGQYEQHLAKDERALGAVTYGTVESDDGTTTATRGVGVDPPASLASAAQIANATLNGSGTARWAKANYNAYPEYGEDCTNFVSKALHSGGGMRMKGVNKDRKGVDNWWSIWKTAPHGVSYHYNSYTWTGADYLHRFLERHSRGMINTESKQYEAKVGDIVLFNWQGRGGWDHAGVITKMAHGKAYVSAHTSARLDKRLDSFLSEGTWADIFHVIPGWY